MNKELKQRRRDGSMAHIMFGRAIASKFALETLLFGPTGLLTSDIATACAGMAQC
jgi:hypothetical protein